MKYLISKPTLQKGLVACRTMKPLILEEQFALTESGALESPEVAGEGGAAVLVIQAQIQQTAGH